MLYCEKVFVEPRREVITRGHYLSARNLKAISLASLLFIYLVLALSFFSVSYTETIHRVTRTSTFEQHIFGSAMGDSLAVIGLTLLFLSLSSRLAPVRIISVAIFGVATAAFISSFEHLLMGGMMTVPFLTSLFMISVIRKKMRSEIQRSPVALGLEIDGKRVALAFLVIVIIIEAGALARWVSYPAFPTEIYSDPSWRFAELESALFHSFGLLSPVMLVLLTFSFLFKGYIGNHIGRRKPHIESRSKQDLDSTLSIVDKKRNDIYYSATNHPRSTDHVRSSRDQRMLPIIVQESWKLCLDSHRTSMAILLGAVGASVVIMLYPYFPGVNESGTGISTDEAAYIKWLSELRILRTASPDVLVSAVFNINSGDRPLSLLVILLLGNLTGFPDSTIIRFLPVILAPALVLSSYMLVRHGYSHITREISIDRKRTMAAVIAFAAAISPQVVVGLYGGFLANWLALIPALFSMLIATRMYDEVTSPGGEKKWRRIAASSMCLFGALTLTMMFHIYTWGYVILVLILFTAISYFSHRRREWVSRGVLLRATVVLASIMAASVITDYAKSSHFGVSTGLSSDSLLASRSFDLTNFYARWEILDFTLNTYVGGFLSNPVIIMLALMWVLKADYLGGLNRLLLSTIFILSLPILFGTTVIQARLLYVVPLFVPAFLVLAKNRPSGDRVFLFSLLAALLSVAVYSLRAMANLYLVVPGSLELDEPFLVS